MEVYTYSEARQKLFLLFWRQRWEKFIRRGPIGVE